MKYVKAFIKKVCPNVEIKESETKSNSLYYNLDDAMTIRLSDHYATSFKTSDLNIVQVFGKDEFIIICQDTGIPMVKSRKETNLFIKNMYEYKKVKTFSNKNKKMISILKKEEKEKLLFDKLSDKYDAKIIKLYIKHQDTFDKCADFATVWSLICNAGFGINKKVFSKCIRERFVKLWSCNFKGMEFLDFIIRQKGLNIEEINANISELKYKK